MLQSCSPSRLHQPYNQFDNFSRYVNLNPFKEILFFSNISKNYMISVDVSIKSWRSSVVEQLICNQQVGGSNPFASSTFNWIVEPGIKALLATGATEEIEKLYLNKIFNGSVFSVARRSDDSEIASSVYWGRGLSGQRQQTVNLPVRAYAGSNPALPTNVSDLRIGYLPQRSQRK